MGSSHEPGLSPSPDYKRRVLRSADAAARRRFGRRARARFATDPQPLFAAVRTTGLNSIFVRGDGHVVRLRVDGRIALSTHTRRLGCTEIVYDGRGRYRVGLELGTGVRRVGLTSETTPDPLPVSAADALFARVAAAGARLIVLSPWEPPRFDVRSYHALVASVGAAAHPNERGYRTIASKLALRL